MREKKQQQPPLLFYLGLAMHIQELEITRYRDMDKAEKADGWSRAAALSTSWVVSERENEKRRKEGLSSKYYFVFASTLQL